MPDTGSSRRFDGVVSLANILPALLLALLAMPLVGCGQIEAFENERADDAETETKDERVPVEVATLERGPIEAVLRFSTNLEAESSVEVYSQSSRLVTELLVEEGDRVRSGQVLLRLQDAEQKSALARAESQLAKAQREYQRQKSLFAKELISEQVMNDATYEVDQLELAVEDARRELSYTTVRAPIGGTITSRLVNLGDNVKVGEHLFDIVDFDSIVARIFVPEKDMARLRLEQAARLRSEALAGSREGQVIRVAPIVDPRSGTVKVTSASPQPGPPAWACTSRSSWSPTRARRRAPGAQAGPSLRRTDQVFVYRLIGRHDRVERLLVRPVCSKTGTTSSLGRAGGRRPARSTSRGRRPGRPEGRSQGATGRRQPAAPQPAAE